MKFKIKRYDPEGRHESYLQAYDVDVAEGMTVLDALLKIRDLQDGTLAFRYSCRSSICGSCAVTLNGYPRLACRTQVIPEFKKMGDMLIEPLYNHMVIKDLVIDQRAFWRKLEKITPYLSQSPAVEGKEVKITREEGARIDSVQKCIMCGSCNAACNALEVDQKFIAPAALAKSWRFVGDVRDGMKKKRLGRLTEEHGMWDCIRCLRCTEYCPKDVDPMRAIERLRSESIVEGLVDNHGARHVESMIDSIKRVGRVDEAAMTFRTLGIIRSLGMIPFGLKMEMHGKMPLPILFPVIDGIEEVRKICEAVEDYEKGEKE